MNPDLAIVEINETYPMNGSDPYNSSVTRTRWALMLMCKQSGQYERWGSGWRVKGFISTDPLSASI